MQVLRGAGAFSVDPPETFTNGHARALPMRGLARVPVGLEHFGSRHVGGFRQAAVLQSYARHVSRQPIAALRLSVQRNWRPSFTLHFCCEDSLQLAQSGEDLADFSDFHLKPALSELG
jgi:hypothetical protein